LEPFEAGPDNLPQCVVVLFFGYSGEVVGQFRDLTD